VRDIADLETGYYIRLEVADKPGVLAAVASVFGEFGVSIASVIQKRADAGVAEIVYVTHTAREAAVRSALDKIGSLDIVDSIAAIVRVEAL
jgi:homoserine dehydrogenase